MTRGLWSQLDTPSLRIDLDRLERNLEEMAAAVSDSGLKLRPHIKSHKMVEIARRQMDLGAVGLSTAKLSEAEALAAAGLKDLFVCYPLIGAAKLRRLRALSREVKLMTIVDSAPGARDLASTMAGEAKPLEVLLKVDVGMHRVGVSEEHALDLAALVSKSPGLRLRGVCIHEGSTYAEPNPERRIAIAHEQAGRVVKVAQQLRSHGHDIEIVSSGATPGVHATLSVEGLTETRPGNYVFYDAMQVALGVADLDHCALSVISTVVSHAAPDRAVIDAGSKTLTMDRGAHGTGLLEGYGFIPDKRGLVIENLSEEHGWLSLADGATVTIGEYLDIVPNHACPVVNNFDRAIVTRKDQVVDRWSIEARGCLT